MLETLTYFFLVRLLFDLFVDTFFLVIFQYRFSPILEI